MQVDSNKQKALESAIKQIDKAFGKGMLVRLGDKQVEKIDSISTGSLGLDLALGIGGIPKGRIIEIYAHKRKCDFITQKEEIWNISAFAYFLFDDSLMPSLQDSTKILKNGCKCMVENLSLHFNSIKLFLDSRICYIPAILLQSIIIHSLHAEYNTTTCNVLHKDIESLLNAITHHANEARFPIDIYLGIFLHCYTNLSYYISNNLQF